MDSIMSNPFLLAIVVAFVGTGVMLYLTYFFDRILIKKRISKIDMIILAFNIVIPLYCAFNANIAFDQDLKQGVFSAWGKQLTIVMVVFAQFLIRAKRIKVITMFHILIIFSVVGTAVNFYITQTFDPRLFVDTDAVGYNPAKGGYVFRFNSEPAMIGAIFFFISFISSRKWYWLIGWGAFMAYMLFIDKGRIDIVALFAVMGFAMIRNLNMFSFLKMSVIFGVIGAVTILVLTRYFPSQWMVLRNMLLNFAFAIVGVETGEGSVDARFIQFKIVFDYFAKYPEHMIFGTGILNREAMLWRFGELYLKDIGIVGIFFAFGLVGMSVLYGLFVYALRLTLKITILKWSLAYKLTESVILMIFISSFFNGNFVWNPGTFLTQLLFLHTLSLQERDLRIQSARYNLQT